MQQYLDAGIRPDICWRDAGGSNTWYPTAGGPVTDPKTAWLNTGTWEIDAAKYPQGFRPYSDRARANGMQFLLWFEPERVGDPNSWLGRNHPGWLLPGNSAGAVLNLGDPAALAWLTSHIDRMVKTQGLDWYREDLNGGRRNDLETMRRAVPLLRSDWSVTAFAKDPLQIEGNQAQTFGLSSWLPWQGAGVPFFTDAYAVRSYYVTGFGMIPGSDWTKDEAARSGTVRGYAEARRIGPLLLGDYYPLTPYSLDTASWMAWQFYRPDLGEGVVQAFRRPDSTSDVLTVKLRGLDPKRRYRVENLDGGGGVLTGAQLMERFDITLPEKPAAAVLLLKAGP